MHVHNTHIYYDYCVCLYTYIGLLLPPTNIQLSFKWLIQFLKITFSWKQPFTLNLTSPDSENTITYQIFLSIGNMTLDSELVYNTEYTYNYSITLSNISCSNHDNLLLPTFEVSAINRVGSSEKSNPVNIQSVLCTLGIYLFIYLYNIIMTLITISLSLFI